MESTENQTTDIYHWVAWVHAKRKQLILGVVVALLIGLGFWLYIWNGEQREVKASEALSDLKPPARATGSVREPIPSAEFLKIANDHPGTAAGSRAQLLAGGVAFGAGNFKDAQAQFEKFLADYPDSPWLSQAQLGVAASLEAQGNAAEAAKRYQQFVDHHPQDAAIPQAKSALAGLYIAQNKPELAFKLYQELARERNNDSWTMEATVQAQELLAAHPELRPKPVASPAPPAVIPSLSLTGAPTIMMSPAPSAAQAATVTNLTKPK